MGNDIHLFQPIRVQLGFWCGLFFIAILINVRIIIDSDSMVLGLPLALLIGVFTFLFVPFLKNQKIIINNQDIRLFTFGRINELVFCKHINKVVVKENKVISYQFEKNGKYFQISPLAYYDDEELASLLSNLTDKYNGIISVVEK